ncbi:MAG: DUF5668 domain-containing protein [Bryobacteraceae bacterium]|nr:DUF5668 domain-containing protein [Bryobacteraceae bacterium]
MNRNAELMRALRGPVLLIAFGVLLTADRFAGIPFSKTWPVLLIVLGVLKLLERTALAASSQPETGSQAHGG